MSSHAAPASTSASTAAAQPAMASSVQGQTSSSTRLVNGAGGEGAELSKEVPVVDRTANTPKGADKSAQHTNGEEGANKGAYDATIALERAAHIQALLAEPVRFVEAKVQPAAAMPPPQINSYVGPTQAEASSSKSAITAVPVSPSRPLPSVVIPSTPSAQPRAGAAITTPKEATPSTPNATAPVRDLFIHPIPMVFARDTVSPSSPPVGLRNNGNTCYQNSVMQALLHTAPLANIFVTRSADELRGRAGVRPQNGFCVIEAMQSFAVRALIFAGRLRSRVHCGSCGYDSDTFDPFLDLSLDIRSGNQGPGFGAGNGGGPESVLASLTAFTRVERLDGKNKYRCEKCKKLTVADKQFTLDQVPPILTIQLKRFTITGGKIGRAVNFPETLKLDRFMSGSSRSTGAGPSNGKGAYLKDDDASASPTYRLYAVVHHFGGGPNSGHYVATVRRGGRWFRCDDSSTYATENPTSASGDRSSAYILFYQREGLSVIEAQNAKVAAADSVTRKQNSTAAASVPASPTSVNGEGSSALKRRGSMPPPPSPAAADGSHPSPSKKMRRLTGPAVDASEFRQRFAPAAAPAKLSDASAGTPKHYGVSAFSSLMARAGNPKADENDIGEKVDEQAIRVNGSAQGKQRADTNESQDDEAVVVPKRKRMLIDDQDEGEGGGSSQTMPSAPLENRIVSDPANSDALRAIVFEKRQQKKKQRKSKFGVVPRSSDPGPGLPSPSTSPQKLGGLSGSASDGEGEMPLSRKQRKRLRREQQQQQQQQQQSAAISSPFHAASGGMPAKKVGGSGNGLNGPLVGQRPGASKFAGAGGFASKMAMRTGPR
ncbi:hypothetical protein OC846_003848 [Tilletia horrida]|uniref:ubiquitinyl hydrolase 1 n=1 Tax=Tilletia horrida TaxID=155126 RepID=A0AAN6JTH1_9BASI|nr:hypothetical protein OC846_003848 [Tilletia horrida]